MDAAAFDFAYDNPGIIAVSVLEGPDSGELTGEELVEIATRTLLNVHGVEAVGYYGNNGTQPTEITYHFLLPDLNDRKIVRSMGPYNLGDALEKMPEAAADVKAIRLHYGLPKK